MSKSQKYTPPNLWVWDKENGGKFAKINRPISGFTYEKDLPKGNHPFQLYSQGTPNGCLLYTSPSPRDATLSRMPSSA